MADVNIDAALVGGTIAVTKREEKMVELSNGCICCTLREDLLQEVRKLALERRFDYLLIESSGISEPLPVAETFTFEDDCGASLSDFARLDTLVTVVDGSTFLGELESMDSLKERKWEAGAEDARTVAHLLCDQIEFANVLLVNKCDLLKEEDQRRIEQTLRHMNNDAEIILTSFGVIDLPKVLHTKRFSLEQAEKDPKWLKEARVGEHNPETAEFGVSSFTYGSQRPFHGERLKAFADEVCARTRGDPAAQVLRAKGFAWLAGQPNQQAVFSFAGRKASLLPGPPWSTCVCMCL
jgi:G3E family GTPase